MAKRNPQNVVKVADTEVVVPEAKQPGRPAPEVLAKLETSKVQNKPERRELIIRNTKGQLVTKVIEITRSGRAVNKRLIEIRKSK